MWPLVPLVGLLALLAWSTDTEASMARPEDQDDPTPPGEHFSWDELQSTSTGLRNVAPAAARANLRRLVEDVLEPLRALVGRPVRVGSAYRSPEVNAAIGGAKNSQHLHGLAVDVRVDGATSADLGAIVVSYALPFDQMVIYDDTSGKSHTHISIAAPGVTPRGQILVFDGQRYTEITPEELLELV